MEQTKRNNRENEMKREKLRKSYDSTILNAFVCRACMHMVCERMEREKYSLQNSSQRLLSCKLADTLRNRMHIAHLLLFSLRVGEPARPVPFDMLYKYVFGAEHVRGKNNVKKQQQQDIKKISLSWDKLFSRRIKDMKKSITIKLIKRRVICSATHREN